MRQIARTEQRQKLNQKQQHSLKVLSMSGPELEDYLEQCYDNNPFLCKEERSGSSAGIDSYIEAVARTDGDLLSDLYLQAHVIGLNRAEEQIGNYLIGSLDEHGFLPETPRDIAAELGLEPGQVEHVLRRFQANMDPAGVFAANVTECLLIQLARLPGEDLARDIVRDYLPQLAAQDFECICLATGAAPEAVEHAVEVIRSLQPYPFNGMGDSRPVRYRVPELEVVREGQHLDVALLDRSTSFSLNASYQNACRSGLISREDRSMARDMYNEAKSLVEAVEQRRRTVLRVSGFLVEKQQDYFLTGAPLTGLTQTDVAASLRISVSTVSRTVREKYYRYENEVYDLSGLFATRLNSGISRNEIQSFIGSLIATEPKANPISDAEIARYCTANGHPIARRTVSKYREMMKIPPASQRRTAE